MKPGASDLLWCDCGDGHVVYDQLTGNTHALDELAASVLRLSLADPGASLADLSPSIPSPAEPDALQAAREQLVSCGLL